MFICFLTGPSVEKLWVSYTLIKGILAKECTRLQILTSQQPKFAGGGTPHMLRGACVSEFAAYSLLSSSSDNLSLKQNEV